MGKEYNRKLLCATTKSCFSEKSFAYLARQEASSCYGFADWGFWCFKELAAGEDRQTLLVAGHIPPKEAYLNTAARGGQVANESSDETDDLINPEGALTGTLVNELLSAIGSGEAKARQLC